MQHNKLISEFVTVIAIEALSDVGNSHGCDTGNRILGSFPGSRDDASGILLPAWLRISVVAYDANDRFGTNLY
jgi:hypothetical protein